MPLPVRRADVFKLQGHTLDGKFCVERVVAEGGFAVVYQARHVMLDRPVALKVLKTPHHLDAPGRAAFIESFAREARAMVQINHPNIVQVLDFGVNEMPTGEQAPWMALEWCEGGTLRDALALRRSRSAPGAGRTPAEALALLRPALEALAYAHEEGIAHRDIKPANIMVVSTRRGTTLKLLDFGVAKVMDDGEDTGTGHTQTHAAFQAYSLHYAAPEQIGGTRTGPWTDVHALGLILTELLTDQAPYRGQDRTEICCEVLAPERPTPGMRGAPVGPWEPVLKRALAVKPSERYKHAGELLDALEAALAEQGALAPPLRSPTLDGAAVRPYTPALPIPAQVAPPPAPRAPEPSGLRFEAPASAAPVVAAAAAGPFGAAGASASRGGGGTMPPISAPMPAPLAAPQPFANVGSPFAVPAQPMQAPWPAPPPAAGYAVAPADEPQNTTLRGAARAVSIAGTTPRASAGGPWPLVIGGGIALAGVIGLVLALRGGSRAAPAAAAASSLAAPPAQAVTAPPVSAPSPSPMALPVMPAAAGVPVAPAVVPPAQVAPAPTTNSAPAARAASTRVPASARVPATPTTRARTTTTTSPRRGNSANGHVRVEVD